MATVDAEGVLAVVDAEPSDIRATTVVLRMLILCLILTQRHLVATNEGTALAVGIVLPRTSAIVIHLVVVGRDSHSHTEFGHYGFFVTCGTIFHIHPNTAVTQDGVAHFHIGGIFPDCSATGKTSGMLVVVFRFPEVGFQRALQHLLAVNNP